MTFIGTLPRHTRWVKATALAFMAGVLASCAPVDDTTGSRLAQPAVGTEPRKPTEANDIGIVGQEVSHAILALPAVADATVPPKVQFTGVTSIVTGPVPVDTEPYTNLLRDRLLLLTRLKLRFVEKTLPPLVVAPKKGKKAAAAPKPAVSMAPDFQIVAELRGHHNDKFYRIQVQFIDLHTSEVLFDGLYKIKKEGGEDFTPDQSGDEVQPQGAPPVPQPQIGTEPTNPEPPTNPTTPGTEYVPPPSPPPPSRSGGSTDIY